MEAAQAEVAIGIRELSERTGLSMDTLRWYEREGLLPLVDDKIAQYRRLIARGLDCADEDAAATG